MPSSQSLLSKFKSDPVISVIGLYAIFGGLLFFAIQSSKLLWPAASELDMQKSVFGRFEWGSVWSDTLVAGPMLLIGGLLLFGKYRRIGGLFVFSGFAINLYAMVFLIVGLRAVGRPMVGGELYFNLVATLLGVLCMAYLAYAAVKEPQASDDA
jgi:hypothetical protein